MADIFDDDRWVAEEPKENFGQVIRFRKHVHRALAIEPCGETWRAVIRCQADWRVSWWSAPGERDALLSWGRKFSEDLGMPLYVVEPGKGYRSVPRSNAVPVRSPRRGYKGASA